MKKFRFVFFLALILSAFCAKAQLSAPMQQGLDKAEQAMFNATSNGDSAAFRKLAGTDYFTINADGSAQGLEEALPFVPRFKGSTYKLSDQKQRSFGDVVLRTGKAKFYFGGQQVAEVWYTSGWIYRKGGWQFIHWQGTLTGMSLQGKGMAEPPKN
jgi:hypothetical protein